MRQGRVLKSELYRLCSDWWMFLLSAALIGVVYFVIGNEFRSTANAVVRGFSEFENSVLVESDELMYYERYSETLLYRLFSNGTGALLFGLLFSFYFFALNFHERTYSGAIYAGISRSAQVTARLVVVYVFSVVLSAVPVVLVLALDAPEWMVLPSFGELAGMFGKFSLAALAAVSLQVLIVFVMREFFRAIVADAGVAFLGVYLIRVSDSAVKSGFVRVMCWHPSVVQRGAAYWGAGTDVVENVCLLVGITLVCTAAVYLVFRRAEVR